MSDEKEIKYEDYIPHGFVISFAILIIIAIALTIEGWSIIIFNPLGFVILIFGILVIGTLIFAGMIYLIKKYLL